VVYVRQSGPYGEETLKEVAEARTMADELDKDPAHSMQGYGPRRGSRMNGRPPHSRKGDLQVSWVLP
jgi:hypothetical protein